MAKKVICPWGCGKKFANIYSHKQYCQVRNRADATAESPADTTVYTKADAPLETTAEKREFSNNDEKGTLFNDKTHTFQELTSEWNKVKDELKVSDDELLPQKTQKSAETAGIGASAVDGAQLKSYEVLANSLHQSVNDFIIFATKGKLRMQKEQLDRLNECGAQVLNKYDKNGTVAKYVPELAYVLTLTDVVAQVLLVMKKDEVKNGGAKDNSGTVGREGQTNQGIAGAS